MPAYLDHNATSPLRPGVLDAMLPWLGRHFGNPSSGHRQGRLARQALEEAREQVATAFGGGCRVVFTSGGTEANHLALSGLLSWERRPGRLVTGATEHPAIREPARRLAALGVAHSELAADACGQPLLPLPEDTALLSLMLANNETGILTDLPPVLAAARSLGALVHSDGAQAPGRLPLDFPRLGVDALSISGHKFGGPKGVGALLLRPDLPLRTLLGGGGQEHGLRSGTENLPGIIGMAHACTMVTQDLERNMLHMEALRRALEDGLRAQGACIFGMAAPRLVNTCAFGWPEFDGETLVMALDRQGFSVSSGSACSSGSAGPNPVLAAMGVAPELGRSLVRVSLGPDNTQQELSEFLQALTTVRSAFSRLPALSDRVPAH